MYLVEYVQKRKTEKFNYCSGFYDKQEAFDFAIKLGHCANVIGVTLSFIDTSYAEILYKEIVNDK